MSFLLHCNQCFNLPDSEPRFYYTSCGHFLCKICVQNLSSETCPVCGAPNMLKLDLMSNSPQAQQLRTYFSDPFAILEHGVTKAEFLKKFQNSQMQNIIRLAKLPNQEFANLDQDQEKAMIDAQMKEACNEQVRLQKEHDEALNALKQLKSRKKTDKSPIRYAEGRLSINRMPSPGSAAQPGTGSTRNSPIIGLRSTDMTRPQAVNAMRASPLSLTHSPASSIGTSSPLYQNSQIRSNDIVHDSCGLRLSQNYSSSSARVSRESTVPYGNSIGRYNVLPHRISSNRSPVSNRSQYF